MTASRRRRPPARKRTEVRLRPIDYIRDYMGQSGKTLESLPAQPVSDLIGLLEDVRKQGGQVFVCGNGGSAAMASHLAGELGKEASWGRDQRFRVISLADNLPWILAIANDLDFNQIFVEQLKNFGCPGDLLIVFSTSGNSGNVLEVVRWANENQLVTVGITGEPGGQLAHEYKLPIRVPSSHTGRIQEGHFLIQHLIAYYFAEQE